MSFGIQIGQELGNYRILSQLGAGGMGEVFLAEDLKLGRKIAIKLLHDKAMGDAMARRRLIREAKAAANLDHPNICTIHEVNDEGPRPFIVMQYVEGENLASRIKSHPLELLEVVHIAVQMCEALVEAHSHRIIHRDIKPLNVILTARGQVKILDFGLAKLLPETEAVETEAETLSQLTDKGQIVGTVGYMSPEQLKGEAVDSRTDIFSLGVLLYNCATGRSAFTGSSTLQICLKVIQTEPLRPSEINANVPPELERIIIKAIAKDVESRYQSAGEMLADLLSLKATLTNESSTPPASITRRSFRHSLSLPQTIFRKPRKKPLIIALVIAPLALALLTWLALQMSVGAVREPSPEARVKYEQGTDYIREGAYYQAMRALSRAIEIDKQYALAHARLAEAYMEMDSGDKAREEIVTALSLVPDRTSLPKLDALYLEAIAATVGRKLTEAINYYRQIADQAPESAKASAFMDLGRAYERNEDIDNAIALYQQASVLNPDSAGALLRLAILYGRKQDLNKATEAFEKAETAYREMVNWEGVAEVLLQRGTVLTKFNKNTEARAHLDKTLAIAREFDMKHLQIRAQLQLSNVYIKDDAEQARAIATEAIRLAQANNLRNLAVNGLIDLGYTFLHRGEHDEAGKHFGQALDFARADQARKSEARALLALGMLNVLQANDDEGIRLLEQSLEFYQPAGYRKESSLALTMLGRAQRSKGNFEEAINIFTQQLKISEELGDLALLADGHLSLALTLGTEQERYPEALPHIEKSYEINRALKSPINAGFDQMNRAGILWQMGRYAEARDSLKEALAVASRPETEHKALHAWVYMVYAQMALSEGNYREARQKAARALELAGTEYRDLTAQANYTAGLAEALSGGSRAAIQSCEQAVALGRELKSPVLVSSALLALGEARLAARDAVPALQAALEAREMFARAGRQDSEWRALLVAARASQMAGNRAEASDYALRAGRLIAALQEKWGATVFEGYARRPDIKSYRDQLTELTK